MSQVAQTDCLRAEAEHYRRGRDTVHATAGSTYWMLNDNWPTASWASLEYGGRPKLLHYAAADFNAAVAVSSYCTPSITACTGVVVHIGSDLLKPISGAVLQVRLVRWSDGVATPSGTEAVSVPAQHGATFTYNSTAFAKMLAHAGCASVADCFVAFDLLAPTAVGPEAGGAAAGDASGTSIAPTGSPWLTLWKDAVVPAATLTLTAAPAVGGGNAVEVTVTSDAVAPQAMVHCGEPSDFGSFDVNGVTLLPRVPFKFVYTPRAFAPAGKHTPCTAAASFYVVGMNTAVNVGMDPTGTVQG